MFVIPVLLILMGLVVTFAGIGFGSWMSRHPRAVGYDSGWHEGKRLALGVLTLLGAATIVIGIADGFFRLITGS